MFSDSTPKRQSLRLGLMILALVASFGVTASPASAIDTSVPQVDSFSLASPTTLTPGDTLSVNYAVSDDSGTVTNLIFGFDDPIGGSQQVRVDNNSGIALSGTINLTIPESWPNGAYTLGYIRLFDAVTNPNSAIYWPDGTISKSPAGATGPTTHTLDFSTANFTITGSSADTSVPQVDSFSLASPTTLTPGDTLSVNYAVSDDSGTVTNLIFGFDDPIGGSQQVRVDNNSGIALSGTINLTIPESWPNGAYTLGYIRLFDAVTNPNSAIYWPDGTISKSPAGATGPTTHTLDFSTANFTIACAPSAPSGVGARPFGDLAAQVSWAPSSGNGSPVTSYEVVASPGGAYVVVSGEQTTAVVGGLMAETSYTFSVVARNTIGDSPPSTSSSAVTAGFVPAAPQFVLADVGGQSITVSWEPTPDNGYPVTGYTITGSNGAGTKTVTADTTQTVFTGLTRGQSYSFTVVATNAVGDSPASAPSDEVTVTALAPDAPTKPGVALDNRAATITWETPAGNGSPITGYTITGSNGAGTKTVTADTTQTVFTGLTRGQSYSFTVVATNAVGDSPASAQSDAVTPTTLPLAPTEVTATGGHQSATITWTAPTSQAPITGYTITATPGSATATVDGDQTSTRITGLTNGTTYTFTVTATSSAGDSGPSAASNPVTPQPVITAACTQAQADAAEAAAQVKTFTTKVKKAKKQLKAAKQQLRKAKGTGNKTKIKRATTKVNKTKNKVKKFTKKKRTAQTALANAQTRIDQNC